MALASDSIGLYTQKGIYLWPNAGPRARLLNESFPDLFGIIRLQYIEGIGHQLPKELPMQVKDYQTAVKILVESLTLRIKMDKGSKKSEYSIGIDRGMKDSIELLIFTCVKMQEFQIVDFNYDALLDLSHEDLVKWFLSIR
jgi:hypothetical protein